MKITLMLSPLVWFFTYITGYAQKVFLRDYDFITSIFTVVIIDAAIGSWKWVRLSKFNEKKLLTGMIEKLLICILAMALFNVLINAAGNHPDIASYMSLFGVLAILLYPGLSCFKNMFFITKGKFPPIGWMRKMENFNNTADIDEIFKTEQSKQDEPTV